MSDFLLQQINCYQKEVTNDHLYPSLFPATPIVPAQNPAIGKQPATIPGGGAGIRQYFIQGELWEGGWQQGQLGKLQASKQSRQIEGEKNYELMY